MPQAGSGAIRQNQSMLLRLFLSGFRALMGGYIRPHINLPQAIEHGPALLVCNHPTVLDPVILGLFSPRRPRYLVAGHLFDNPLMSWFFRWTECIPVGRNGTFEAAAQALDQGHCVGIFPEATMTGQEELAEFRSGVARLALRTGCPVYPIGVAGTLELFPPASAFLKPGPVAFCGGDAVSYDPQLSIEECLESIKSAVAGQVARARQSLQGASGPSRLGILLSGLLVVPVAFVLRRSEPVSRELPPRSPPPAPPPGAAAPGSGPA